MKGAVLIVSHPYDNLVEIHKKLLDTVGPWLGISACLSVGRLYNEKWPVTEMKHKNSKIIASTVKQGYNEHISSFSSSQTMYSYTP